MSAIILGPGLGQNAASENIVRTVTASDIKIPLIIDADGTGDKVLSGPSYGFFSLEGSGSSITNVKKLEAILMMNYW